MGTGSCPRSSVLTQMLQSRRSKCLRKRRKLKKKTRSLKTVMIPRTHLRRKTKERRRKRLKRRSCKLTVKTCSRLQFCTPCQCRPILLMCELLAGDETGARHAHFQSVFEHTSLVNSLNSVMSCSCRDHSQKPKVLGNAPWCCSKVIAPPGECL